MLRRSSAIVLLLAVVVVGSGVLVAGPAGTQTPAESTTPPPAAESTNGPSGGSVGNVQEATCSYEQLYNETISGVAQVRTTDGIGSGFVFRDFEDNGTSFVVTNEHVVGDAAGVVVRFSRGETRRGTVVGTSALTDLAVVRVNDTPGYVERLPLAEGTPNPGERVAAFGSPFGLERTITAGIVSGVNRRMPSQQGLALPSAIQTDAPINPGNSGGPLVLCENGRVAGVNRAGGAEDIGFAIPADVVRQVAPVLIQEGEFAYPWLGISAVDLNELVAGANDLNTTQGVMVVRTAEGSPAAGTLQGATGFVNVSGFRVPIGGDVILAINDTRVNSTQELQSYLLTQTRPGDTVELTILRNGSRTTVDVTVGERPVEIGAARIDGS